MGVEVQDIAVEVEPAHLRAVAAVELVSGPAGVDELAVEDPIVHRH